MVHCIHRIMILLATVIWLESFQSTSDGGVLICGFPSAFTRGRTLSYCLAKCKCPEQNNLWRGSEYWARHISHLPCLMFGTSDLSSLGRVILISQFIRCTMEWISVHTTRQFNISTPSYVEGNHDKRSQVRILVHYSQVVDLAYGWWPLNTGKVQ